jgi:hypothetical protein
VFQPALPLSFVKALASPVPRLNTLAVKGDFLTLLLALSN